MRAWPLTRPAPHGACASLGTRWVAAPVARRAPRAGEPPQQRFGTCLASSGSGV